MVLDATSTHEEFLAEALKAAWLCRPQAGGWPKDPRRQPHSGYASFVVREDVAAWMQEELKDSHESRSAFILRMLRECPSYRRWAAAHGVTA